MRRSAERMALPLLLCAAALCPSAGATPPRSRGAEASAVAASVLTDALEHPPGPYEGMVTITRWFGKQTRAEEVRVYWGSEGRYRWEFLAPDGQPERFVVCDGLREELRLPREHKTMRGEAVYGAWKLMSRDVEQGLLFRNYRASLAGTEKLLGRPVRIIDLIPNADGKPRQRLWIDAETRAILENKRYVPGVSQATVSRFTRYMPKDSLPDSLFELEPDSAATVEEHELDPDFLTIADLDKALGRPSNFPQTLPAGFQFESADFFNIGKKVVRHLRYTDGLVVLSLFETDRRVRLAPDTPAELVPKDVPGSLRVSSSGRLLQWKTGNRYYTLIGELSGQLLARISADLRRVLEPKPRR